MTARRLLTQSIRHHWRTHLGVVLGSALAALVLAGALMVGDSVKATLRAQAEARVGKVGEALVCGERFVPWAAAPEKRPQVVARMFYPGPDAAGIVLIQGSATRADGKARANRVQVIGVDEAFWKLAPGGGSMDSMDGMDAAKGAVHAVHLNTRLAAQLGAKAGDEVLIKVEKPGALSKDAPLSGGDDAVVSLRLRVARVVGDAEFGRFALTSGQVPPHTAFIPLAALQEKLGLGEKVNVILRNSFTYSVVSDADKAKIRRSQLVSRLTLGITQPDRLEIVPSGLMHDADELTRQFDNEIVVSELPNASGMELRSPRVFLNPAIVRAARTSENSDEKAIYQDIPLSAEDAKVASGSAASTGFLIPGPKPPPGLDSLTYFVNELRLGDAIPGLDVNGNLIADAPTAPANPIPNPEPRPAPKTPATPYSFVTALDAPASGFVQAELADDEIQITRWLADDLGAKPGDKITMRYFVMGERRELIEKARTFTVLAPIIEMNEPRLDTSWMPDFPNIPDKDGFSKWKPGFPFDSKRIRKKDDDYWRDHRGTPKAFVNLKVGQEMWGNRWGNLTSIRYYADRSTGLQPVRPAVIRAADSPANQPAGQIPTGRTDSKSVLRQQVERIAAFIEPEALGFRIVPLREQALAATDAPVDFGQLFTAFSFFLIAAAAVLTGLLFTFSIEQRAAEAGLLLAVGWTRRRVKKLFLREGTLLAVIGSVAGVAAAALYTKAVLHGLAGAWSGATGGTTFLFAPTALSCGIGLLAGVVVARIAMGLASRRLFKREAAELLAGEIKEGRYDTALNPGGVPKDGGTQKGVSSPEITPANPVNPLNPANPVFKKGQDYQDWQDSQDGGKAMAERQAVGVPGEHARPRRRHAPFPTAFLMVFEWMALGLVVLVGAFTAFKSSPSPMVFFALGFALLAIGVFIARRILLRVAAATALDSTADLAARNTSRRRGRSLATIAVLASGVFMVVAVDSFRKDSADDATRRDSGTGGFALIGESAAPIYEDLNTAKGRAAYALDDKIMQGVRVVQMRVRDGDDASCLNLNRAMQPRIVGADFDEMDNAAFASSENSNGERSEVPPFGKKWATIKAQDATAIPGVVDANTLQWAMQKKLGDVLEIPGERGEPVRVQFSATVNGSILQGIVLIPEKDFIAKFPNTAGYRFFLIDCPPRKMAEVREHLSEQLADRGLELTPAAQRLAEFNAVENTYLSIFQVLGGLGMLLGSAGLGIVVARNVLERRREFGLLEAVGFTPRQLRALVFAEHRWLIVGALGIGAVSALVAVWPGISQKGGTFPWMNLAVLFGGMALIAAVCAWFATRVSLRGSQLEALRSE